MSGWTKRGPNGAMVWETPAGYVTDSHVSATAAIKQRKLLWSVGTSPPASPSDGDVWVYQASLTLHTGTEPVYWMFVYDSTEATYKWQFVGGAPARSYIATSESMGTASAWSNLTTVGPDITIPRTGIYVIDWNCNAQLGDTSTKSQWMAPANNGNTDPPADPQPPLGNLSGVYQPRALIVGSDKRLLTATQVLRARYYTTSIAGTPPAIAERAIRILPAKVI